MKKYFYLFLLSATFANPMALQAQAQNNPAPAAPAPAPQNATNAPAAFRIARVEDDQVATLRNLHSGTKLLVYLGASAEAVQADAAAFKSLKNWIKGGGVMAVYSDAATLFGFDLQIARQGNPQQGGQLFGRAISAVPLGSEPLLWKLPLTVNDVAGAALPALDDSAPRPGRRNKLSVGDPTEFAAVTVYYQLQPGDSLLVSHPTATPLLRVTDLAQPQTNLFASAITSYGNGWIIFLPDQVESQRAQSGQFLNNIVSMAANPPLPVDINAIAATADTVNSDTPNYAPLLKELQKRLAGNPNPTTKTPAANEDNQAAPEENNNADDNTIPAAATAATLDLMPATLQVPVPLAKAMVRAISDAQSPTPPANAKERVAAAVALWMLQAKLQRAANYSAADDDTNSYSANVNSWLQMASDIAPSAREVLFWKGAVAAQDAANVALPSPRRAAAFAAASNNWNEAATATPLLTPVVATTSTPPTGASAATSASFGEISPAILTDWAKEANKAATVTALEPPVATLSGRGGSGVVIRHFSDDPTLRLAFPSIQKLQSLAGQFGWIAPNEEVLVFPNEAALTTYANRLGPLEPGERPLASAFGRYGRVLGNRILMVSQPSQPIILPGPPPRVIQTGTAAAAIVGRLHGELLLNALTEDGTPVPIWMRLGVMNLASDAVTVENTADQRPDQELLKAGQTNQLLSPDQFNAGALNKQSSDLADMESKSLMSYFYQQFGSGAVMETAQRLGSGEDIDQALQATTQMNEAEFFTAWYAALQNAG